MPDDGPTRPEPPPPLPPPRDDLPDLPDEVDINTGSGDDPRSASSYDGVYADGVPIGIAMAASRWLESGNNYGARAALASASGAYQIIDSFWNNYRGYPRAFLAPPAVQDQFAYEKFVAILKAHNGDVSKIPVSWYFPAALRNPALMDRVPMPEAGNQLTIREYQTKWMKKFYELLGQGSPPYLPANDPAQPLIRSIAFPVLGPTSFINDWGFPRDGGRRSHEGNDLMGVAGQPLRAAADGIVTRTRYTDEGTAGAVISITDVDGYRYNYFHLNNDGPNGQNRARGGFRIHPDLMVGRHVKAGQIIAYMGDTGNAPGVPHLHFEIRDPEGNPFNPYPSLLAAQQREQCSTGVGPWSTFFEPDALQEAAAPDGPGGVAMAIRAATTQVAAAPVVRVDPGRVWDIVGPDGARWTVSVDGEVRAVGTGALITPGQGECTVLPEGEYGTDAKGLAIGLLPDGWMGERVDLSAYPNLRRDRFSAAVRRLGVADSIIRRY